MTFAVQSPWQIPSELWTKIQLCLIEWHGKSHEFQLNLMENPGKSHWIPWKMTWNPTKSYEIPLLVSPKSRWLGQNHHRQGRSGWDGIPCGPTTGDETKVAGLIGLVSLWFQRTVWCPEYPGPNNGICWNILEFTNDGIWWMVCHFTNYNGNTSCNRATNVLTWGF